MAAKKRVVLGILIGILLLVLAAGFVACNKTGQTGDEPDTPFAPPVLPDITPTKTVTTTKLITYDAPTVLTSSQKVGAVAGGESLFVYETLANHSRSLANISPTTTVPFVVFDFEGKLQVELTIFGATTVSEVVITPKTHNITPTITGNKISFWLEYPDAYTVEYKTNLSSAANENAVHIFSNLPEAHPLTEDNLPSGTLYLPQGIYDAGALQLESNQTVYLAGGAVVFGQLVAENKQNITVRGRGILNGSLNQRESGTNPYHAVRIAGADNVRVQDITIVDPAGCAVLIENSKNVVVENIKVITARQDAHGVEVSASQHVVVQGSFLRAQGLGGVVNNKSGDHTNNVTFFNTTIWTEVLASCQVGYQTSGERMQNIRFIDITVLHSFQEAPMRVLHYDNADIQDILFQNITVHHAAAKGENPLTNEDDAWFEAAIKEDVLLSHEAERGSLQNLLIRDVVIENTAATAAVQLLGANEGAQLAGVVFHNVRVNGTLCDSASKMNLKQNDHVQDVQFAETETKGQARHVVPYLLALADQAVAKTNVAARQQSGVEVPSFAYSAAKASYMGRRVLQSEIASVKATHGVGASVNAPYDDGADGSAAFSQEESGLLALVGESDQIWQAKPWKDENAEFVALTFSFVQPTDIGTLRLTLPKDNAFHLEYRVRALIQTEADGRFVSAGTTTNYHASPASGNYFDVRVGVVAVCAVQLRFYRTTTVFSPKVLAFAGAAILEQSVLTNKQVICFKQQSAYPPSYANDSNDYSLWESREESDFLLFDLDGLYLVTDLVLFLPPTLQLSATKQEIEVFATGRDIYAVYSYVPRTTYTFEPKAGNYVHIQLPEGGILVSQLKLEVTRVQSAQGNRARFSEVYLFGDKAQ